MARSGFIGLLLALVAVGSPGCGGPDPLPKLLPVQGTVTRAGKPWPVAAELGTATLPPGASGGSVVLVRKGAAPGRTPEEFVGVLKADGATFTVPGLVGTGVPPGDYDAVVYLGAFGGKPPPGKGNVTVHGREVGRKAVTVTEAGPNDIAIDLPAK